MGAGAGAGFVSKVAQLLGGLLGAGRDGVGESNLAHPEGVPVNGWEMRESTSTRKGERETGRCFGRLGCCRRGSDRGNGRW